MKIGELKKQVGFGLERRLDGFKFYRSKLLLKKEYSYGWQALWIDLHWSGAPGNAKLVANAHLRIEAIAQLCHPYSLSVQREPKYEKERPTIGENCDNLFSDASLIHSFPSDPDSVEQFLDRYVEGLKTDILPFLDKYSDENALFEGFIDPKPINWITGSWFGRFTILMAISVRRGNREAFEGYAKEFLEYCDDPLVSNYMPDAEAMIDGLRGEFEKREASS